MIVGRQYILQSLRNNKAFRPATNASSAVLEAYTRPTTGIENFLFKLESSGSEFLFKHVASNLYLTASANAPGSDIILSALSGSGTDLQRWQINGLDASTQISPSASAGGLQMALIADNDRDNVTTQPASDGTDNKVAFVEFAAAPSGLVAPVLARFFRNYQFISVTGIAEGATVKIYVDDTEKGSSTNITGGTAQLLTGTLQIGQRITAEQILSGVTSPRSTPEFVQENGKVWKMGYAGNLSYQAFKTVVTGITDTNNVETIQGQKGEPLGPVRASADLALVDLQNAGLTETQFNSAVVTPPVTSTDSINAEQKAVLDNWMNNNRGSYNGNVQCVLWKSNNEVYRYTAGHKAINTPSGIASLSKWFFGTVATKAVQDGVINWSDTLGSKVPIFNSVGKGTPTFKQLMCHMGGWPEESSTWAGGNPWENRTGDTLTQCAENIANTVPHSTPGASFVYSGIGMQLAGRMLEVAYGLPIQTIIQNLIWGPLGMTLTTYTQPGIGGPTENPQLAAGLWSAIDDFGKFMRMLLKKDGTVINSASAEYMEADQTGIGGGYGIGVWTNNGVAQPYHQGASGCQAWLNRTKGYCGLIFTYDSNPAQANPANSSFLDLVRNTL